MSAIFEPKNLRFAIGLFVFFYTFGIYIFMLPAYLERLRHSKPLHLRHLGAFSRKDLYTLIFFLSPLIFLLFLGGAFLWLVISAIAFLLLILVSPLYWLYENLPGGSDIDLLKAWKRFAGRMFEHSRKLFSYLAGEDPVPDRTANTGEVKQEAK